MILSPIFSLEQPLSGVGSSVVIGGGGGAGISDGNKGDITVASSATIMAVNYGAITVPKLASDAASRLVATAPIAPGEYAYIYDTTLGSGFWEKGDSVLASELVYTSGAQEISGLKNFINRPSVNNTGVVLSGESTIPNPKTNGEFFYYFNTLTGSGIWQKADYITTDKFVYTTGLQSIGGIKEFTTAPTVGGVPVVLQGDGSYGFSRGIVTITTPSIASGETLNTGVNFGCKSYSLFSVTGASGAWVKLYYDSNSRTNDNARTIDKDPASNVFLMAECLSTGNNTIRFAPATIGYNEGIDTFIPLSITNTRNTSTTYTIEFKYLKL